MLLVVFRLILVSVRTAGLLAADTEHFVTTDLETVFVVEVHRLSADNRYRPFDNRHTLLVSVNFILLCFTELTAVKC